MPYRFGKRIAWYEESPWKINNPVEALKQLKEIENAEFEFKETREVYSEVCNLVTLIAYAKNRYNQNRQIYFYFSANHCLLSIFQTL